MGTEHHIFHLHAHQWLFAALDDDSNYVDAQALGPGSSFTYEIAYGGSGKVVLVSVIDNLVKGAAGQAVQNLNLMFKFPEATGLAGPGLFP